MLRQEFLLHIQQNIFQEEFLDLSNQDLMDEDVLLLVKALKENIYIKKVKLCANKISDNGAIAIASISTLEEVDLSENKISQVGAEALFKSVLKRFNITGNPIDENPIPPTISDLIKKQPALIPAAAPLIPAAPPLIPAGPSPQNPIITSQFTGSQQQTQLTGKRKASELMTHPDFSDFFRTASLTQIKQFFDSLKDQCLEIQRKKQKKFDNVN